MPNTGKDSSEAALASTAAGTTPSSDQSRTLPQFGQGAGVQERQELAETVPAGPGRRPATQQETVSALEADVHLPSCLVSFAVAGSGGQGLLSCEQKFGKDFKMGNGAAADHVGQDAGVKSRRSGQVRDLGSSPAILCTVIGGVFALVVGVLGWLVMDVNSTKARAMENSIALARLEAKLDAQAERLDNMDATLIRIEKKLDLVFVPRTGSPVRMDGKGSGQIPASFAVSQGNGRKTTVSAAGPRCLAHPWY